VPPRAVRPENGPSSRIGYRANNSISVRACSATAWAFAFQGRLTTVIYDGRRVVFDPDPVFANDPQARRRSKAFRAEELRRSNDHSVDDRQMLLNRFTGTVLENRSRQLRSIRSSPPGGLAP